jgi:hypothetical protein
VLTAAHAPDVHGVTGWKGAREPAAGVRLGLTSRTGSPVPANAGQKHNITNDMTVLSLKCGVGIYPLYTCAQVCCSKAVRW